MKSRCTLSSLFMVACSIVLGWMIWFVSLPVRAGYFDRFILYYIDDVFRYNYVKTALYDPWVFINPFIKSGFVLIQAFFLHLSNLGISSLRIVSALCSLGTLFFIRKIMCRFDLDDRDSVLAMLFTFTFPLYFLVSLSSLAEIMFVFFLLWGIYLFLQDRYFASTLIIAFLPTIRQDGIIFVLLWLWFLPARYRVRFAILLFTPIMTWVLLNMSLLKHSFLYTFFCNLPDESPATSRATFTQFIRLIGILIVHPAVFLGLCGLKDNYREDSYRIIKWCFLSYTGFLFIGNVVHLFDSGAFCRELRFYTPLIPFLGIYAAIYSRAFFKQGSSLRKWLVVIGIILLPFIGLAQIKALQSDPTVKKDSLSIREEMQMEKTGQWLKRYMNENGIKKIFFPGELLIDKYFRRLWLYLPGDTKYYQIVSEMEYIKPEGFQPVDLATYTIVPLRPSDKGIFINSTTRMDTGELLSNVRYTLIQSEDIIPLHMYSFQSGNSGE